MAYVIAEPCIGTKDTACVDVCPVDCIHPRKDEPAFESETQLYISPVECIDCGACVPVCPGNRYFRAGRSPGEVEQLHGDQRGLVREKSITPFIAALVAKRRGLKAPPFSFLARR